MNENSPTNAVAGAIARHTAGAVGVGAAVGSHDEIVQLLGTLIAAASLAWSIYEKFRAAKTAAQNQTNPTQTNP